MGQFGFLGASAATDWLGSSKFSQPPDRHSSRGDMWANNEPILCPSGSLRIHVEPTIIFGPIWGLLVESLCKICCPAMHSEWQATGSGSSKFSVLHRLRYSACAAIQSNPANTLQDPRKDKGRPSRQMSCPGALVFVDRNLAPSRFKAAQREEHIGHVVRL